MNYIKLNAKTLNNRGKTNEDNKIHKYQFQNKYENEKILQAKKYEQRLINIDRNTDFNRQFFSANENKKEYSDIFINNKRSKNIEDINDNINIKNISVMTEPRNKYSLNYIINNKIKNDDLNNIDNSMNSNNNNSLLKDIDLIYDPINQIQKTDKKPNLIEQNINYSEFFKMQFDSNLKNNESEDNKIELNNIELIKKYEDLIEDNRLLNEALNERTSKLNKIIKENVLLKSHINQLEDNNKKSAQKIKFYEEQFSLFKNNSDNYQKIINELKLQNEKLNNIVKMENNNEFQKNMENDFKIQIKEEILNIKKNLNEISSQNKNKNINNDETKNLENKINNLFNENKTLKEMNDKLNSQNELINIENKKLFNQNYIYLSEIEKYKKQINDFNQIIENKDTLINSLKEKDMINAEKKEESSELSKLKINEKKLKEEKIELNNKVNELNLKLDNIINKNKNTIEELKQKENEIKKLIREINNKDKLYKTLKSENNDKIKELEMNLKKCEEEIIEKNKRINELKTENDDKIKIISELNNKIKEKEDNTSQLQKQTESKLNKFNNNINNSLEKESNSKENIDEMGKSGNENINNKKENKIEENKEEKTEKKEERRYIPSLRNKFLRKKEEQKRLKEKEKENNINNKEEKNTKNEDNKSEIKEEINKNEIENNNINKSKEIEEVKENKEIEHGTKLEEEKDEIKENIRQMTRKKNYSYKPRTSLKNTDSNNENNKEEKNYYLYGIDRNDYFHKFDINNKKYEKIKISQINLDDKSSSFKKDYQYEGTILYNTLEGVYILTGEKTDTLYYYNSKENIISKICKFNLGHNNGNILYDTKNNNIFVFGGKKVRSCEYFNINDKKIYNMPDLITDRANASFIISNEKIFGFFGFSYEKNHYSNNIEYIDYNTKDKWIEIKDINLLQNDITFDIESTATMYYKNKEDEIMIYNGIRGDDEDFITEYYLIYNIKNNTMSKIKNWDMKQFKLIGKKWKDYKFRNIDPQGFHFAKNTNFLYLNNLGDYSDLNILIDYKNNVHFVEQNKEKIEIYRGNI